MKKIKKYTKFASRQKLQNLVFPNGIYFDKNTDDYRTETENEVFKTFRLFSSSCGKDIEKATTDINRLSLLVGMRRHLAQNTSCHTLPKKQKSRLLDSFFGRDEATRTPDPYVPNVVRYQLRYIPKAS